MNSPSFVVSRFKNRNGALSFRVDGRLNGVRIRRNFKTQEEAAAEKTALKIKALQLASDLRAITTQLSEAQVREAEVVFRRLIGNTRSLSFCGDYPLANQREPDARQDLTLAVIGYVEAKTREQVQEIISICPAQMANRVAVLLQPVMLPDAA